MLLLLLSYLYVDSLSLFGVKLHGYNLLAEKARKLNVLFFSGSSQIF